MSRTDVASSWDDLIGRARAEARFKHGENSMEKMLYFARDWAVLLMEEVGEVAKALTYDHANGPYGEADYEQVRAELVDVLTVTTAWIDAIDRREMDQ